MGGAISLLIASEGLVDACAVTAPGIKLPTGVGLVKVFGLFNINLPHSEKANDFFNETYLFRNLKSVKTLLNIANKARKNLDKIACPIFVCHSHNDPVITSKIVDWIKERAKGEVKVKWFDNSQHTLPLDVDREEVAQSIAEFFDSLK